MNGKMRFLVLIAGCILMLCSARPAGATSLAVADFDSGAKPNNRGGDFGAWDKDPSDTTQGCHESFSWAVKHGNDGYAMKIAYDVDSPNPAYNGFWLFLEGLDATSYEKLHFFVKGDEKAGYTTAFKVELKNANEVGRCYVRGITDSWQEVVIPLKDFRGISDLSKLTEFVIVFEDWRATDKDGAIYIDDIRFSGGE